MGLFEFLTDWKMKAETRITDWAARFQASSTNAVYGTLVSMGLLPVVEALASGADPQMIERALATVLTSVGGSLLAGELKAWLSAAGSEEAFVRKVTERLSDPEFRKVADEVVSELDAIGVAKQAVPAELQDEFVASLTKELQRLGNLSKFEAQLSGGSAQVIGEHNKVVGSGQLIDGNVAGDVLGKGAVKTTLYDNRRQTIHVSPAKDESPDPGSIRKAYLEWVFERDGKLALEGIDPATASGEKTPMRLNHVYTTLMTMSTDEQRRLLKEGQPIATDRLLSAVEMTCRHRHLVLLGDPGSGKSTFVSYLSLCMAGEILGRAEANLAVLSRYLHEDDEKEEKRPARFDQSLIPVKVILRDYVSARLENPNLSLWQFIQVVLQRHDLGEFGNILKLELTETGGMILLDGLDEVPQSEGHREAMIERVGHFRERFSKCRILVTSRTYAYEKQQWQLPEFTSVVLAPFNDEQIEFFVRRWYEQVAGQRAWTEEDRESRSQRLLLAIQGNDKLRELACRPILLTLMAGLHAWRGGTLPDGRQRLYAEIFPLLLDRWEQPKYGMDDKGQLKIEEPAVSEYFKTDKEALRRMLEKLAYDAHAKQEECHGTADIAGDSLAEALLTLCAHADREQRPDPVELQAYLENRAGILHERGGGIYAFPHRSFQEYLAACYCTSLDNFTEHMAGLAVKDPDRWREVCLLAAAEAKGMAGLTWDLVDELFDEGASKKKRWSNEDKWGLLLAAQVIQESCSLKGLSGAKQSKVDRIRKSLPRLLGSDLPATERALAGRLLAQLGDPRKEVMTVAAMPFHEVPAGPFWMGCAEHDQEAYEDEKPGFENNLDDGYFLARYPVSNAQYRYFVEAGGYREERFWPEALADERWKNGKLRVTTWRYAGELMKKKEEQADRPAAHSTPFDLANHPVVGVSWYEAMAFCHWLADHLKTAKGVAPQVRERLNQGWRISLPSEAQWEKAARGVEDHRLYPWGDKPDGDKASYRETKVGSTSALGCFPRGHSPSKCEEMSGNVWEWCRTPWQENYKSYSDETEAGGKEQSRVLRGGSFFFSAQVVRCSYRNSYLPFARYGYFGFRVCVCPHFSEL